MFDGFVRHGELWHPAGQVDEADPYRALWNREADEDAVYSATGIVSHGREDYATLTATRQRLWREFPRRHLGTVLEVGCGYGRVAMLLSRERGVTCERYIGVDIARQMLARFARYRREFDLFPGAGFDLVCASIDDVPLEDDSIDVVVSSGVFLHMGKQYVERAFAHLARALRPGGAIVFDTSFPNARAIGGLPARLYGRLAPPKANRVKHWTRGELERLMRDSGLEAKVGRYTIEPTVFAVLPNRFRRRTIPLAATINRLLDPPPRALEDVVATMYSVHSPIAPVP